MKQAKQIFCLLSLCASISMLMCSSTVQESAKQDSIANCKVLVQLGKLPYEGTVADVKTKLDKLGYSNCTVHDAENRLKVGPYIKCPLSDQSLSALFRWGWNCSDKPNCAGLYSYKVSFETIEKCSCILNKYRELGFDYDSNGAYTEIASYTKEFVSENFIVIVTDHCGKSKYLEIAGAKNK
ncbi:MAG: hypothetical protein GF398_08350 [Chitinivibrionales bacterium]|nr:hypothetical protein [Chitinivibrionales bacterium]